jgi:membrane fusion protein (multidrug efflux system)
MIKTAAVLITCLLATLFLAACDEAQTRPSGASGPVEVSVVTLHPRSVDITAELPGRVTARLTAEVRPQVDGIILKRLFTEGGEVKEGEVLYQIDPAPYQAAYDSALAALKKAEAVLPSDKEEMERNKKLILRHAISKQDLNDSIAAYAQDLADIAAAKAEVETARINLGYTKIKAPISGIIGKSSLTPGALVTANQATALATIRQLDPINVDVTQSSAELLDLRREIAQGRIKVSDSQSTAVKLKLENGEMYPSEGLLKFSEVKVNEDTGTYTLRAEFPNPDKLLLPGMYVRAVIKEGVLENSFLAPQRGVTRNTKGEPVALFVNKDGKVEQRVLRVERSVGNNWLIESGLSNGDRLIVEGSQWISPGQEVTFKEVVVDQATGELERISPNPPKANASTSELTAPKREG